MNGIWAAIIGIVLFIGAYFTGKIKGSKETETKISGEVTIVKKEKEIQQDVTPVVVEAVKQQATAEAEYRQAVTEIEQARENKDTDSMGRIISDLAQKALSMGATKK